MNTTFPLPPAIASLIAARNALRSHYREILVARGSTVELSFTLDGNLVGDIGEALFGRWITLFRNRGRRCGPLRRPRHAVRRRRFRITFWLGWKGIGEDFDLEPHLAPGAWGANCRSTAWMTCSGGHWRGASARPEVSLPASAS